MKNLIYNLTFFLFSLILIISQGCSKEIIQLNEYQTATMDYAYMRSLPQLQSRNSADLLKKYNVKTMTYVLQKDSTEFDSLTFLEFDTDGKIIRRTTRENTSAGCLPYMMRQEFEYEEGKIKKVTNYLYKYVANSVKERWMLRDTSCLNMFDWEDYSYSGDTTTVESGVAIWKYIKDANLNIVKQIITAKSTKQVVVTEYIHEDEVLTSKTNYSDNNSVVPAIYSMNQNKIAYKYNINSKDYLREYFFDTPGFPQKEVWYIDGKPDRIIIISYSYYE